MVAKRDVYRALVAKPEAKCPLGTPRRWWNGNIKIDLKEMRLGVMDWIYLTEDRGRWRTVVNTVMNLLAP